MLGQPELSADETKNPPARKRKQNNVDVTEREVATMKRYNVRVYNNAKHFWDEYLVNAEDPVDARHIAVQRLIDETGEGLNEYEIMEVTKAEG